ncbi:hypothetical protein HDU89_006461 [Geranomyces variabilis]|nr:hypothetical protein HDU89_006461 [Geranomyces variabilis]
MFDFQQAVILNYAFTSVGLAIATCNAVYAVKYAVRRRTVFNGILAVSIIIFALSFVPLLYVSQGSLEVAVDIESPDTPRHESFDQEAVIMRVWTILFGLGTYPYVVLVQIRFRTIKCLLPYNKHLDTAFIVFTTVLWIAFMIVCGVLYSPSFQIQALITTVWALYALVADNLLSFIFLSQLFRYQKQLGDEIDPALQRVRRSLKLLCAMTWIGMSLSVVGTYYSRMGNSMESTVLFRAALMFSPMAYSGAMVYVHTVRKLFAPRRISQWAPKTTNPQQGDGKGDDLCAADAMLPLQTCRLSRATLTFSTPQSPIEDPTLHNVLSSSALSLDPQPP